MRQGGRIEERLDDALMVMRSHAEPPAHAHLAQSAAAIGAHSNGLLYMEAGGAPVRGPPAGPPTYGHLGSPGADRLPAAAGSSAAKKRKETPDSTELAAASAGSAAALAATAATSLPNPAAPKPKRSRK